ncbi:MAG TPA: hypothetical protein PKA00_01505 [Saprospiraceae bacterium]|nr:hypothetical protein [Saprospiraceae bacterium]HMQ81545.1 hypothetical protein [Saprospiraceae bacterium]
MELIDRHLFSKAVQRAFKALEKKYQELEQFREELIQHYLQFINQELEMVEQIETIQQNLDRHLQAIRHAPDFDENQKVLFEDLAQQIAAIGLLFPNYEEILRQKEYAVASNGISFEDIQRGEMLVRLEDYKMLPSEAELVDMGPVKLALWNANANVPFAVKEAFDRGDTFQMLHLSDRWPNDEPLVIRLLQHQEDRLTAEKFALQQSIFNKLLPSATAAESSESFSLLEFLQQVDNAFEQSLLLKRPSNDFHRLLDYMEAAFPKEKADEPTDTWVENEPPFFFSLTEEEDDVFDMAANWDALMDLDAAEYDWDDVEEPLYPLGSSVEIITNIAFFEPFLKVKTKGWQGRVKRVVYDESDSELYFIELDSVTQRQLPEKLLHFTICDQENVHHSYTVPAASLRAVPERDTANDTLVAAREIIHTYMWKDQSEEDQKRLYQIMLHQPAASDEENWVNHFHKVLRNPVKAHTENYAIDNAILPNEPVEIIGVTDFEPEDGLMAEVRYKEAIHIYPLIDLLPEDEHSEAGRDIMLYRLWAEFRL